MSYKKKPSVLGGFILGALVMSGGIGWQGKPFFHEDQMSDDDLELIKKKEAGKDRKATDKRNRKVLKKLKDLGYSTNEGLILRNGKYLSVGSADELAKRYRFQHAELLVKFMEGELDFFGTL